MTAERLPERPPAFTYRRSKATAGGFRLTMHADLVPLTRLAVQYGTPLYVYSASTIRARYQQFDKALNRCKHTICYSVKANSNLAVLRMLDRLGAGFDIVSGGELQRVIAVDRRAAAKVVFSGVGKQCEEIDLALSKGILLFNVESAGELGLLTARAAHLRKPAPFAIRVNPDVTADTHPYISTGLREHKFGVPWSDAVDLYRRSKKNRWLRPTGISVHIGSQITDVDPFAEAMDRVAGLVRSLRAEKIGITHVDAGGGLGIFYENGHNQDFEQQAKRYARALLKPLKSLGVHLILEPGRAIVAPAGALLTRVVYCKQNGEKRFAVVDAAMNDLLRPSLYDAYHEIVPVVPEPGTTAVHRMDVVGPICETGDFFARDRVLPNLKEGNLLAILDTGAYGMSLASNYNTRPRAAEVLVDGKRSRLARKRESIRDLLAPERL